MDTSMPFLGEPCTPKSRKTKAKLNAKSNSQPTPTRSRRCYDPQRRLEVADTRRNGACARCREKKVRCSPAQHKSPAGGSPQTSTDAMSNSSRSPRNDDPTRTNNVNKDKESGGNNILGIEGCVQAAREYLKVAQSHVTEFARFVEAWESSQKHPTGRQLSDEDVNISGADSSTMIGRSPQRSKSSSTSSEYIFDSDSHVGRPEEVHKFLSDLGKNTYIYKDHDLVSPTSMKARNREKTTLAPKDRNRPLRPKPHLIEGTTPRSPKKKASSPATRGGRASLRGENEPWVAFAPLATSQVPPRTRTSSRPEQSEGTIYQQDSPSKTSEQILPWSTDHSPSTPSKGGKFSSSTLEETFSKFGCTESPSMLFPIESNIFPDQKSNDQPLGQPSEDFQFHALIDDFEVYGNAMGTGFNFGLCFDQDIPQGLEDPFVSSLMTSQSSLITSEPLFNQAPSECVPTAWGDTSFLPLGLSSNANKDISAFNNTFFSTPATSLGIPSLNSTPWSFMSEGTAPATPQDIAFTPSRTSSGQRESLLGFWEQEKQTERIEQLDFWRGEYAADEERVELNGEKAFWG